MGPASFVKSDSFLSPTSHSLFSFFFSFFSFFSTFLSLFLLLYLFFFLFFFRAKSHPHQKTKESQPSSSTASLLRSPCHSLSFTLPTPTHLSLSFTLPTLTHPMTKPWSVLSHSMVISLSSIQKRKKGIYEMNVFVFVVDLALLGLCFD